MAETDIRKMIRNLRLSLGLTQEQFAVRLGVTFSTVNRWERRFLIVVRGGEYSSLDNRPFARFPQYHGAGRYCQRTRAPLDEPAHESSQVFESRERKPEQEISSTGTTSGPQTTNHDSTSEVKEKLKARLGIATASPL